MSVEYFPDFFLFMEFFFMVLFFLLLALVAFFLSPVIFLFSSVYFFVICPLKKARFLFLAKILLYLCLMGAIVFFPYGIEAKRNLPEYPFRFVMYFVILVQPILTFLTMQIMKEKQKFVTLLLVFEVANMLLMILAYLFFPRT